MSRQRLLILTALTLLCLPTPTLACGGFFCMTTPIDQSAERIIFLVNKDETITAIVGINYTGAAEDFSWVVPVPSPPVLDVAETASLDALQLATDVRFNPPDGYCNELFYYDGRGGGGGGGMFLEEGHVGPYDYAILGSEDPDEMITWLRDNGYRITEEMEPLVQVYVEEGMYFLAMKLSQQAEVGDIQPVVMTYESTKPMIPIRLTAVAAIPNMPIITWIFADTQYMPENYAHPQPDFSQFQTSNRVKSIGRISSLFDFTMDDAGNFLSGDMSRYQGEQRRIQERFDGLAFITEYAAPTSQLPEGLRQDPLLQRLQDEYDYLTRLRAQMSPDQMTVDPMFIPAPSAPDVSNVIELDDYVDPLHYWGCSSRTALGVNRDDVPDAHTRIDSLQLDIAHPVDWQLSEFSIGGEPVRVFAPEAVDASIIQAAFRGDDSPPMFVIVEGRTGDSLMYDPRTLIASRLEKSENSLWPGMREGNISPYGNFFQYRVHPFQYEYEASGVAFAILADGDDWAQHEATYRAMLDYAASFQYYLRDDLPHTMMLGTYYGPLDAPYNVPVFFSYPEGWVEHLTDGVITASLDDAPGDAAPLVRLLDMDQRGVFTPSPRLTTVEQLASYNLSEESIRAIEAAEASGCNTDLPAVPFEQDGRAGYVRFERVYLIEASVAAEAFADYDETLLAIAESMTLPLSGCG